MARAPLWTRLRRTLRDGGLLYRGRVALARVAWFECLIVAIELDRPGRTVEAPPGVSIRPLEAGDVDALLRLRPDLKRAEVEARLDLGHLCVAVWLDGEIVAASWTRFDCIWPPILRRSIPLEEGEAYTYDSYTDQAHRRRGIATLRAQTTIAHVRALGYRRIVACILPRNPAGLAAAQAAGALPVRRVRWLHLGHFGVESVRDTAGAVQARTLGWRRPEPELPLS